MNRDDVELIERRPAYRGSFRIDLYRLRHRLHDGRRGDEIAREVFDRGHVAAVLPVDPIRDRVVLIEQFRPGAYAAGWQPWLLECVAGIIEPGESVEDVCARETMEESGCRVTDLWPIARFLSSPGASTETVSLYCGRVDSATAGGIHGLADEGEDIRVVVEPVPRALALLGEGRIVNAKTIVALQWLALNYERVKEQWRSR